MATQIQYKNSTNAETIKPYNVEYGERAGFENVVQRVFFMPDSKHTDLKQELVTDKLETCYGSGGRDWHNINEPYGMAADIAGSFYINPQSSEPDTYSHIHAHSST